MKSIPSLAFVLVCVIAPGVWAQARPQAYTGATIIPISGPVIQDGILVIERGKILSVGARNAVQVPAGAETIDASGKVIMPGLVDSHSHIGSGTGADNSAPIQPEVRILDSINVLDNSLKRARAGGITTVNVMPGSSHLLSGQTLYLKLRLGKVVDDLLIKDAQGRIAGGMKMANGTNSLRPDANGPFPGTRARSASLVREQFVKAQEYREKVRRAGSDKSKLPARDLAMEALVEVLDGRRTVHFHTHRHDDILTALRLAKEFGFRVVLHHVTEGWKVAEEIARAKAPASVTVIDAPGGKLETTDVTFSNGMILDRAGVLVGFNTDDYITDSRLFLRAAALSVRAGMARERALYAMTLAGAQMLDLQDRTGSLQPGKDADFIILSGDPLSVYTHVLETYVEGAKVFDRANPNDRLYATGGEGAGRGAVLDTDEIERSSDAEGGQ
jgi:imidazolonepropionase-like amidohydrolase